MFKQSTFDATEYLTNEETIAAFLKDALDTGDKQHILACLRDAAKARIINQLAPSLNLDRDELWDMFADNGDPEPAILTKVAQAFVAPTWGLGSSEVRTRMRGRAERIPS
jgi:probable addiction module antidote protein